MDDCTVEVTVNNKGAHARPSAIFVQTAASFDSNIIVEKDNEKDNGKSIMGLLRLAIGPGSVVKISADGFDAPLALKELKDLLEDTRH
ncbi:MAG: HPr family phosphocarrier protein [Candidatus Omnitrophota bacterium]